jgi:TatD DNase family protein
MKFIDTHTHIDGKEFADDLPLVMQRAREAGVIKMFVPAIDLSSIETVMQTCRDYPGFAYPMMGLHPEEVKSDYKEVLEKMRAFIDANLHSQSSEPKIIAIGEVGLDYYWSREYESEQLVVFEEQVKWSIETRLPLMIHCRKGQNEMVKMLRRYEKDLPGGVFHCFTGNEKEASELLSFEKFALGIGGVLTFKKSHLPEVLTEIPLSRIVLETDSPYMSPVPKRGERNESANLTFVIKRMAECYGVSEDEIAATTNDNVNRIFHIQ